MNQSESDSLAIKTTLLLTSTLTVMSGATIAPSLPAMQEHFAQVPNSELLVRLVLTVPALFIAIGGLFVGQLLDRLGRKPLLMEGRSGLLLIPSPLRTERTGFQVFGSSICYKL